MKNRWYHGDTSKRASFLDQKWDRDRTIASANEYGPGIYFTSSFEEASGYGPHIYEAVLKDSFRLFPKKRPTAKFLNDIYKYANSEDKEIFLSNWSTSVPRIALSNYLHSDSLHDAALSLYGDLIRDPDEWVQAMRSVGYDGVVIDRKDAQGDYGKEHLVLWSPDKAKIYEVSE